ncbi:hypothetical protein [Martelella sp. HB161492]|uniref:hypothetical protein n=1 Tax=Martelella sp. HB161492 TaxID=2720726 RepID=UPI00159046B8|nr:hypothetical protein [Martelella sp. HB161492]
MKKLVVMSVLAFTVSAGACFAAADASEKSVAEVALAKLAKVGDLVSVEAKDLMDEDVVKTYRVGDNGTFKLVDMHAQRH